MSASRSVIAGCVVGDSAGRAGQNEISAAAMTANTKTIPVMPNRSRFPALREWSVAATHLVCIK